VHNVLRFKGVRMRLKKRDELRGLFAVTEQSLGVTRL
jgi:hypothetical protein